MRGAERVNWLTYMNLGKLGQALTAREMFDLIQPELEQVERKISAESVASVEAVTAIGQYLQSSGGKRLRPALLLLSAKLSGGGGATAIQLGAVVELIHAATLVHDDVIDTAQTRRGRPSTNVKWGNHTCVLAGDWLYMQAFQIALRERNFQILDLLIGLTQMMVEGELLQLERIGKIDVSEADCRACERDEFRAFERNHELFLWFVCRRGPGTRSFQRSDCAHERLRRFPGGGCAVMEDADDRIAAELFLSSGKI